MMTTFLNNTFARVRPRKCSDWREVSFPNHAKHALSGGFSRSRKTTPHERFLKSHRTKENKPDEPMFQVRPSVRRSEKRIIRIEWTIQFNSTQFRKVRRSREMRKKQPTTKAIKPYIDVVSMFKRASSLHIDLQFCISRSCAC